MQGNNSWRTQEGEVLRVETGEKQAILERLKRKVWENQAKAFRTPELRNPRNSPVQIPDNLCLYVYRMIVDCSDKRDELKRDSQSSQEN